MDTERQITLALAGVAQWAEFQPMNQKVVSSIPVRVHASVADQVPIWGSARGN